MNLSLRTMLRKRSIQREAGRYSTEEEEEGEGKEEAPSPPEGRQKEESELRAHE